MLCLVWGLTISGTYTVGYVFYVENLPKAYRIQLGLLIDFAQAAVIIYIAVYLQFISKNMYYLQFFSISNTIIGGLAVYFYVKETPRYLIEKGKKQSAYLNLRRMAYINGKMTEFEHYVEINNISFEDVTGNDGKLVK